MSTNICPTLLKRIASESMTQLVKVSRSQLDYKKKQLPKFELIKKFAKNRLSHDKRRIFQGIGTKNLKYSTNCQYYNIFHLRNSSLRKATKIYVLCGSGNFTRNNYSNTIQKIPQIPTMNQENNMANSPFHFYKLKNNGDADIETKFVREWIFVVVY